MICFCGNDKFNAHQVVHQDVIVDGDNNWESSGESYDSNTPFGPYTCTECSHEFDELTDVNHCPDNLIFTDAQALCVVRNVLPSLVFPILETTVTGARKWNVCFSDQHNDGLDDDDECFCSYCRQGNTLAEATRKAIIANEISISHINLPEQKTPLTSDEKHILFTALDDAETSLQNVPDSDREWADIRMGEIRALSEKMAENE
jgi:hypothetical protein